MYTWIWRHLPGPTAVRTLEALLLFLIVVALLFFVVFPWLEPYLPFDRPAADPAADGPSGLRREPSFGKSAAESSGSHHCVHGGKIPSSSARSASRASWAGSAIATGPVLGGSRASTKTYPMTEALNATTGASSPALLCGTSTSSRSAGSAARQTSTASCAHVGARGNAGSVATSHPRRIRHPAAGSHTAGPSSGLGNSASSGIGDGTSVDLRAAAQRAANAHSSPARGVRPWSA